MHINRKGLSIDEQKRVAVSFPHMTHWSIFVSLTMVVYYRTMGCQPSDLRQNVRLSVVVKRANRVLLAILSVARLEKSLGTSGNLQAGGSFAITLQLPSTADLTATSTIDSIITLNYPWRTQALSTLTSKIVWR